MAEFHKQLLKAMNIRNISQNELCKKTNIPKSAMSQYMSGKFKPKQTRTYILAKALDINEAWLMGFDDVPMNRTEISNNLDVTNISNLEQLSKSPNTQKLELSKHESDVISAYRSKPEMQPAVDRLLGIEEEKLIPSLVAARSKNNDVPIHIENVPDLSKFPVDDTEL